LGNNGNIQVGDGLSRLKGAVHHWGVYLGMGWVLEIVPKSPPRMTTFEAFSGGNPVKIHRSPDNDRAAILARASAVQGSSDPYHWWSNNCQHLKNYVLTGRRYSEDIQALVGAAAMLGLLAVATRTK